jgi:inward rectifier potassium channel
VHPIDESSPLFNWREEDYSEKDFEMIIVIKGFEETFSQTVYSRTSYRHHEMVYGARFIPAFEAGPHGATVIDFSKIDAYEEVHFTD